jgi:hypothetical protein
MRMTALMCVLSSALVACFGGQDSGRSSNAASIVLPISLNEVMVALINKAADPSWGSTWANPQTEQVGGALLKFQGTGPMDATWTANEQWQQYSDQLAQDGARAVNAVRSRNRDLMDRAGGQLVETCEACHRTFKPDLPTMDRFSDLPRLPSVSL